MFLFFSVFEVVFSEFHISGFRSHIMSVGFQLKARCRSCCFELGQAAHRIHQLWRHETTGADGAKFRRRPKSNIRFVRTSRVSYRNMLFQHFFVFFIYLFFLSQRVGPPLLSQKTRGPSRCGSAASPSSIWTCDACGCICGWDPGCIAYGFDGPK